MTTLFEQASEKEIVDLRAKIEDLEDEIKTKDARIAELEESVKAATIAPSCARCGCADHHVSDCSE